MPAQERGGREDQADARQVGQRGTVVAGPYETCAGSLSPFTTWHTIESLHSRLCIRLGMAFSFRDGSVPPVGEVALGSGLVFGVQPRYEAQWYASRGGCTRCRLLGVAGSVDLLASRADTGQVWIVARQTLLPPCVVSAFASPPHDWRCIWRFLQAHPIRALTQSSAPCVSASGMAWPKPCTMCCARSPTLGWCAAASRLARPDLAELRVGDTPCLRADADAIAAAAGISWGRRPKCVAATSVSSGALKRTRSVRHQLGDTALDLAQPRSRATSQQQETPREEKDRRG
jgi:hypothetical protein